MRDRKWSRRDLLRASTAAAAGVLFAEPFEGGGAACHGSDARSDRGGEEGRQAVVLQRA